MNNKKKEVINFGLFIVGFVFILFLISNVGSLFNFHVKEVTGEVKYDDCRQKINLNKDEYSKQNGTFICNDTKTISGKSMGGECMKTIISDSYCQTVYIYQKPAEETCGQFHYLTTDDTCVSVSPY
ncbi:MAG: hypothetical protein NTU76_00355 [Candidatus Taylorbacteria bacterium]|nr:hypothetical protein [Candidatus Taylorbacteria bacterium]